MNQLTTKDATAVVIPEHTKELIRRGASYNTLRAYGWALQKLDGWLSTAVSPRELNDAVLAAYLTHLHESGKVPSTIAQAVAAVKWRGLEDAVGEITLRSLAGIRREGKERGARSGGRANAGGHGAGVFVRGSEQDLGGAEGCVNDSADERLLVANLGGGCGQRRGYRQGAHGSFQ